ncbi:hypothetical protein PUV54_07345 [Hyphococcus flavus]|uniref:Uncharacterized protein n=1 Tax=Hyphococcus flavus TaxID=1866326 RepID=A0AAF0CCA6_9PROT|nr:hypothetical protein [Hyphococcus flavus]WDI33010.1 hypothetical protein PUV54_07345 [Hyphococcus flavus]
MPYRTLSAEKVIETIDKLEKRVRERFPEAGLVEVAQELSQTARRCAIDAERLKETSPRMKAGIYAVWALGGAVFLMLISGLISEGLEWKPASLVQVLEPTMNLAVLLVIGLMTITRQEQHWKRNKALDYLHELRSIAHVIDMHQLTKDPYRHALAATPSSPPRVLTGVLLERYLDYCSEMLSLTGKLAALFAQSVKDPEVIAGAGDIEQLATALSRKIWQKIMAFSRYEEAAGK